jgi:hypothetical protein
MPAPIVVSNLAEVEQRAKSGGYRLINVETLTNLYKSNREKILLVDTRQEWEHRAGHITESVNFPFKPGWFASWCGKRNLKAFLGPDKEKLIVFY